MAANYYAVFSVKCKIRTPLAAHCCSSCLKRGKSSTCRPTHATTTATTIIVSSVLDIKDFKVIEFQFVLF